MTPLQNETLLNAVLHQTYLVPVAKAPFRPVVASPYLTAREAAAYLRVSYGTFRNWATQIRRTRTGKYTRDDLDTFARTRKRKK